MAFCFINEPLQKLKIKSGGYSDELLALYNKRCRSSFTHDELGYVPLRIQHNFHGKKINRGYNTRWKILQEHEFNPTTDIQYRDDGLMTITPTKPALLKDIQLYFQSRKEDDVE